MRDDRGMSEGKIEETMGLRKGVVGKLGGKGVVSEAGLNAERDAGPL